MSTEKNEKQVASLQLSKSSTPKVISNYFQKILQLKQNGKEFPISLDEVWPLVYKRRDYALKELRSSFIEGEDFNLRQKAKVVNSSDLVNGIKIEAELSVTCLEYFIAKKVRPVFDVYRKVFHATVENAQKSQPRQISQDATLIENQVFPRKLGDISIKCYYTNGIMYVQLSRLVNFLRNGTGGFGKYLEDKLGSENIIRVEVAGQQQRFGNYEAFRNYLEFTKSDIPFARISDAARNIWSVDLSSEEDEPYDYHYTTFQMNEIYETLFTKKVNKHRVMELLSNGRIEKGGLL